jgi:hypothetical protein
VCCERSLASALSVFHSQIMDGSNLTFKLPILKLQQISKQRERNRKEGRRKEVKREMNKEKEGRKVKDNFV